MAAEDTPMAEFDATFGVNTRGVFMCCQYEARHMLPRGVLRNKRGTDGVRRRRDGVFRLPARGGRT